MEQAFMPFLIPICCVPRGVEQAFMPAASASISTDLAAAVKVATTKQVSGHDFSRAAKRSN
jgi:hypothetical protein